MNGDLAQARQEFESLAHDDPRQTKPLTEAARIAREHGVLTLIDVEAVLPGVPVLLRHIDVIVASEGFPQRLTGHQDTGTALAAMAREHAPGVARVTLGSAGSLAICQGREIRTPAFDVPVIDSTGLATPSEAGSSAATSRPALTPRSRTS
jgi:sugar/nucleoside kinase (ribokinase family)